MESFNLNVQRGTCRTHAGLAIITFSLLLLVNLGPAICYFDGRDGLLQSLHGHSAFVGPHRQNSLVHTIQTRSNHRYCGKTLVNVLKLVCRGAYNGPKPVPINSESKKSINSIVQPEFEYAPRPKQDQSVTFRQQGLSDPGQGSGRYRRGVVDDCCINACTLTELISYCK